MSVLNMGKMLYRNLGNSGLKVSVISLGNMINYRPENYEEDKKIVATCLQNGINFFDTSEKYSEGEAQIQLGKTFKQLKVPRQHIVVSTKIHTAANADLNSRATINRKHIKESIKKSLERLQMEHVDVLYAHIHEDNTPLEEICRSYHEVIEEGYALYWATSNWEPEVIFRTLAICQKNNLHKPIGTQCQYNMLNRKDVQIQFSSLSRKYHFGIVGWSALAGGFLTGRYLNGIPKDQLNRFTDTSFYFSIDLLKGLYYNDFVRQQTFQKLKKLSELANSMGYKLSHLALSWAINYNMLSSALIGARTVAQIEDSLKAIQMLQLFTPDLEEKVSNILNNTPEPRINFLNGKPYPPARKIIL